MILYRFRLNIGRPETTFGLTRRHLLIGRGTTVDEQIPLSEIVRVNLQWYGAYRCFEETFRCVIHTRRKTILLSNLHYRGIGRTERRDREYRRFVLSLHKLLAGRGNRVRFDVGQPVQYIFAAAALILVPFLFALLGVACVIKGPPPIRTLLPFFLLTGGFGWAIKSWRMGGSRVYDPVNPPPGFLPASSSSGPAVVGSSRV